MFSEKYDAAEAFDQGHEQFLGDVRGPWRYESMTGVIHDSRKLQSTLHSMGAGYVLAPPRLFAPVDEGFSRRFQPVLLRDRFSLYRVLPSK